MTIDWSEPAPEALGLDARRLAEAVAFHRHHESPWPRAMYLPDGRYVGTASIGDRPEPWRRPARTSNTTTCA